MYTHHQAEYVVNLWWRAKRIDAQFANYLAAEIDARADSGRSLDCDALRSLEQLAREGDLLERN